MKQTFLLFLGISFSSLFAQSPFDWWFFGHNAGIHFPPAGAPPLAVTTSQIYTDEGCSSVSDGVGNLLFYTDGMSVWDKNHVLMPNGTGLLGDASSTTSSMVIPLPGSNTKYYLFTTDNFQDNLVNGFRYSIIDMSLNGGMGDIITTSKNISILPTVHEKIAAVKNAAGTGYWILTKSFPGNSLYAFELTASGLNTTPVITNIGFNNVDIMGTLGYMKVSPDGTQVALAYFGEISKTLELISFNNANGTFGNVIFSWVSSSSTFSYTYGIEFSPNGKYLFISAEASLELHRFDISSGVAATILATEQVLTDPSTSCFSLGALQIGPDGKIYVARYNESTLGVIDNPNDPIFAYNPNGVSLGTGTCIEGLPNFISGLSFNTPTHVDGSLDVLTPDGIFCGNQITPIFQLTNTGDTTIFNFSISYTVNGGTPMTYNWSGSLDTTQSVTITLPILNVGIGMQNLQMTLNTVNNAADGNGSNNSDNANINVIAITGQPLPLQEGFEGLAFPPNHMQVINAAGTTWQKTNSAARAGVASVYIDNFTLNNQLGAVDDIHIDGFAFPYNQTITFEFDVAYAPYTVGESDTLQVLISTDCGQTFQTLYDLSGASLYTAPPTNGAFVPTSWSQWKHFSTDLSGHAGNPNVEFIFRCRNSYENNLYLDNINIIASAVSVENPNDLGVVHIFPNPATEILNIEYQGIKQGATAATLFDLSGKVVKSQTLPLNEGFNLAQMQLSDLAKGIYMLQVGVGEKAFREKVVLR